MDQTDTHPDSNPAGAPPVSPDSDPAYTQTPPPPQIPWEKREDIGRIRAYWRTAMMVLTRPSELEQFLDTPVCDKHAKRFRRVTFQLTFVITLGVLAVLLAKAFMVAFMAGFMWNMLKPASNMILMHMGLTVMSLIGLFLATRSLEWFSSPKDFDRERQDRAISLSCYACSPILIVTVVGAVASLIAVMAASNPDFEPAVIVITLAWWSIFLVWWPVSVLAIHFTTGQNDRRTTIAAIGLPLIWIGQQLLMGIIYVSMFQWFIVASTLS